MASRQRSIKGSKELLTEFLVMDEVDVLEKFASLPKAQACFETYGKQFVYIPGGRDKKARALLVAHADTVREGTDKGSSGIDGDSLVWLGDVVMSRHNDLRGYRVSKSSWGAGGSLGADDRAGCAMLWHLRNLGHSLLVTSGEESGLKGAREAVAKLSEPLKEHVFAVEVDRKGDRQAVFYDIATDAFKKYILKLLTEHDPNGEEWVEQQGSSSDIAHICRETRMCGVNVAAGYVNEHTSSEMLYLGAWEATAETLRGLLEGSALEPFCLAERAVVVHHMAKSSGEAHTYHTEFRKGATWDFDSKMWVSVTRRDGSGPGVSGVRHGSIKAQKTRDQDKKSELNKRIKLMKASADVDALLVSGIPLSKRQIKRVIHKIRKMATKGIVSAAYSSGVVGHLNALAQHRKAERLKETNDALKTAAAKVTGASSVEEKALKAAAAAGYARKPDPLLDPFSEMTTMSGGAYWCKKCGGSVEKGYREGFFYERCRAHCFETKKLSMMGAPYTHYKKADIPVVRGKSPSPVWVTPSPRTSNTEVATVKH